MKLFTSSYSLNSNTEAVLANAIATTATKTQTAATPVISLATGKPKVTVLNKALLLELQKLTQSFKSQIRNSVALIKWLHDKSGSGHAAVSTNAQELLAWQSSFGESLSFRFATSTEAFTLFADTLLRKSYFLHQHAQVNPETQVIKVRVAISRLPELEQELSIVFEKIKPVNYLQTRLLQKQQVRFFKRNAG